MWQSEVVTIAFVYVFVFLFGLIIGSFLNVCITRIPEELSIVLPGSRCPRCGAAIHPLDNIPVLSWVMLGGKCRDCQEPISAMYPAIELLTGILFLLCFMQFGLSVTLGKWLFYTGLILVLSVTDLRTRLLPDAVTLPGLGMGLVFSAAVPPRNGVAFLLLERFTHRALPVPVVGLADGLLGAGFAALFLWGTGRAYRAWKGRDGMGLGDVKMMAMVGAFVGLRDTLTVMLLGTLLGSIGGIWMIVGLYAGGYKRGVAERAVRRGMGAVNRLRWTLARRYWIPLGTYLGVGALLVLYLLPYLETMWMAGRH